MTSLPRCCYADTVFLWKTSKKKEGMRCAQKDCVMKTVTTVQENAEDILAEAQQINEERAAQEAEAVRETEEDGADPSDEGTM